MILVLFLRASWARCGASKGRNARGRSFIPIKTCYVSWGLSILLGAIVRIRITRPRPKLEGPIGEWAERGRGDAAQRTP